jgi:hypothetical protein
VVGDGVWWTGNPEEVHGINWLPITGASLYLTHHPNYTRQNYDTLAAENGGTNWDVWTDLIWMYRAIHDPAAAASQVNAGLGSLGAEAGNSRANTYHWVHTLNAVGNGDPSITADHPLYAVFRKGSAITRVAYNTSNAPITVRFSDGATLAVAANSFGVSGGSAPPTDPPPTDPPPTDPPPTNPPPGNTTARLINAGGGAASPFVADTGFSGGSTAAVTNAIDTSMLSPPAPPQSVLQSERYGNSTYTIGGLTPGTAYQVTLYFSENHWTGPGQRVFHVSLNGNRVLSNFDIYAHTGARYRAIQQNFSASANASGQIVIQLQTVTDNAVINGIRIQ